MPGVRQQAVCARWRALLVLLALAHTACHAQAEPHVTLEDGSILEAGGLLPFSSRNLHSANDSPASSCLVATGHGDLLAITNYTWGNVSVEALSRKVLAVTVMLEDAYAFQVVSHRAYRCDCMGVRHVRPS